MSKDDKYSKIVQISSSPEAPNQKEVVYGLDDKGNLWTMCFRNNQIRWELLIPHERERV